MVGARENVSQHCFRGVKLNTVVSVESIDQYKKTDWWFFDTNCLSELVKQFNRGNHKEVREFVSKKFILIQQANLVEIHKVSGLLEELPKVLATAAFIGVPTSLHPFVRRDLYKHLEWSHIFPNPFGLYELTEEFATELPKHQGFLEAVAQSDEDVQNRFSGKVSHDIGADISPVMVYGYAKWALRQFIESILGLDEEHSLPKGILKNPRTFPSHFTFWFAYRFLYLTDSKIKVKDSDFNDLSLTLAAPICERFYTERRMAHVLNKVKGYEIPSERMVVAAALKYDTSKSKGEKHAELTRYPDVRSRLLKTTKIYSFAELLKHLQNPER